MRNNFRHRGKETEPDELYCSVCSEAADNGKPKKLLLFAVCFSVFLLVLGVMMLAYANRDFFFSSWADLTDRPAAVINGKSVSRAELTRRIDAGRRIIERQYGADIFSGTSGRDRLSLLRRNILEQVLAERLVAREAESLGIIVSDEEVARETMRIGGEVYGSTEDMEKSLSEDGISLADIKNLIRNHLTLQAVAAVKASGAVSAEKGQVLFNDWLVKSRKAAQVVVYQPYVSAAGPQRGGCCDLGGSPNASGTTGCGRRGASGCGQKSAGPVDAETEKKASEAALTDLRKTRENVDGLQFRVTDYGCHMQVDVEDNGKTIKSYSYRNGEVFEI